MRVSPAMKLCFSGGTAEPMPLPKLIDSTGRKFCIVPHGGAHRIVGTLVQAELAQPNLGRKGLCAYVSHVGGDEFVVNVLLLGYPHHEVWRGTAPKDTPPAIAWVGAGSAHDAILLVQVDGALAAYPFDVLPDQGHLVPLSREIVLDNPAAISFGASDCANIVCVTRVGDPQIRRYERRETKDARGRLVFGWDEVKRKPFGHRNRRHVISFPPRPVPHVAIVQASEHTCLCPATLNVTHMDVRAAAAACSAANVSAGTCAVPGEGTRRASTCKAMTNVTPKDPPGAPRGGLIQPFISIYTDHDWGLHWRRDGEADSFFGILPYREGACFGRSHIAGVRFTSAIPLQAFSSDDLDGFAAVSADNDVVVVRINHGQGVPAAQEEDRFPGLGNLRFLGRAVEDGSRPEKALFALAHTPVDAEIVLLRIERT